MLHSPWHCTIMRLKIIHYLKLHHKLDSILLLRNSVEYFCLWSFLYTFFYRISTRLHWFQLIQNDLMQFFDLNYFFLFCCNFSTFFLAVFRVFHTNIIFLYFSYILLHFMLFFFFFNNDSIALLLFRCSLTTNGISRSVFFTVFIVFIVILINFYEFMNFFAVKLYFFKAFTII